MEDEMRFGEFVDRLETFISIDNFDPIFRYLSHGMDESTIVTNYNYDLNNCNKNM